MAGNPEETDGRGRASEEEARRRKTERANLKEESY